MGKGKRLIERTRTFKNRGAISIYMLLSGISSLCYSMIFSIELIYQAKIVGLNPLQLILVGSVQQSVNFLFQTPTGILADMYSRRRAVVLGFLLVGAGYLIEGFVPIFGIILVATGIGGFGATLVSGADAAWIADEIGAEQAGRIYIRAAQLGSIGSLLGIAASAVLVNFGLNLPLLLGGSLFMALSITLALIMPERQFTRKTFAVEGTGAMEQPASFQRDTLRHMSRTLQASLLLLRLRPVLLTILGIGAFYGMFTAGFDRLWPYHLLHSFSFPALGGLTRVVWFCIIEAGIVVTNGIGIEIVRRCVATDSHSAVARAMCIVDGLLIVCVICFALAGQFMLALTVFWLFTTAAGPRAPLEQAWMNQHLETDVRATVFSLRGQVNAIAHIVGGPLLGVIATLYSTRLALIIAGVLLAPALLLYMRTIHRGGPLVSAADAMVKPDESDST